MTEPGFCEDKALLIQADLDGELDVAAAAALAAHVQSCAGCAALQRDLAALSSQLRSDIVPYAAPALLRARLNRSTRPTSRSAGPATWAGVAAGAALAASVMLALPSTAPDPFAPLVASHIRALQPGHLVDVESTDQHTVKPWFDGRIDFAPPVKDLAARGFPLVGGRLDYVDGQAAAALAYRRGGHAIDLYVQRGTAPTGETARDGYTIVSWTEGGLALRAISDLNPVELREFVTIWQETR
jgi:anti-sigma factor RsiW